MAISGSRAANGAPTVVLFTTYFPLDPVAEVTFIKPELAGLRRCFSRVIVVPSVRGPAQCVLSENVEIDGSMAEAIHPRSTPDRARMIVQALRSRWLAREIRRCPRLLIHPSAMRRFTFCSAAADRIATWLDRSFARGIFDPPETLLYTYWLNYVTVGLGRGRSSFPNTTLVSRIHGADIYEQRYRPPCFPLQPYAVEAADRIIAASAAGRDEIARRYPEHRDKLSIEPLGSPDHQVLNRASKDGRFRIVSCSSMEPLKRLDLLVRGLAELGSRSPGCEIEWHHFGSGSEHARVVALAHELLPSNVRWELAGTVQPDRIIDFYRDEPVDLFLSTTRSEGGRPVSMMEAMSCGIPVASTAVGGVPELIGPDNGWLLPPNPSPIDVALALESILKSPSREDRRRAARIYWEENLRAEKRADEFASRLRSIMTR